MFSELSGEEHRIYERYKKNGKLSVATQGYMFNKPMYLLSEDGRTTICIIFTESNKQFIIGTATRNAKDKYSASVGMSVAFGRAISTEYDVARRGEWL